MSAYTFTCLRIRRNSHREASDRAHFKLCALLPVDLMPGVTEPVHAALELFYVWTPGRLAQRALGEFLENHFYPGSASNNFDIPGSDFEPGK